MNYILPLIIIATQLMILPFSFRWIKEISGVVLVIVALALAIWKQNRYLSLFLIWCTFLFFASGGYLVKDSGSAPEYFLNAFGFLNLCNVVLFTLLYYLIQKLDWNYTGLIRAFGFVAVFQSCYIIIQALQLDQFFYNISLTYTAGKPKVCWPVGTWANESLVSWCIAICSPYLLAFNELRYKIGYVLCFIALLLTKSSGGLVAFVIITLIWSFKKSKKLFIGILAIIFFFGMYLGISGKLPYYLSDTHRTKVWTKAIEIWKEKPITGWGLGSFRQDFARRSPEFANDGHWAQAHNDYIQLLYETGIVGFGLFLVILGRFFNNLRKKLNYEGLSVLAFLITALVGFPIHTSMGVLLIISLGIYERQVYGETL